MKPIALEDFGLTAARGFLPATDPLATMHSNLEWDEPATNLFKNFSLRTWVTMSVLMNKRYRDARFVKVSD
jgi:hypothetical protein